MSQRCHPVNLLVLAVLESASGTYGKGKSTAYGGSIEFGAQHLYLDDGCLSVDGTVSSGDFFDSLKRSDVNGKLEYRKRGRVVTEYPASLTVFIRVLGDRCVATLSDSPSAVFHGNSFSLTLGAEWKNGFQLRPASLSPTIARCIASSTLIISDRASAVPSVACEMRVDSLGVPLDNHLIVSLFGADGARLTRLSAGP